MAFHALYEDGTEILIDEEGWAGACAGKTALPEGDLSVSEKRKYNRIL